MIESDIRATFNPDRKEKGEQYRDMVNATYPLFTALFTDLTTDQSRFPTIDENVVRGVYKGYAIAEDKVGFPNLLGQPLDAIDIQIKRGSMYKCSMDLSYSTEENITTPLIFTGFSFAEAALGEQAAALLIDSIQSFSESDSLSSKVTSLYEERFSNLDNRFGILQGRRSMMDGIFSVLLAGSWLSQQPIQGRESLSYKERFFAVLESDTAITDFTGAAEFGTLAQLGIFNDIPEYQLRVGADGKSTELHPDVLTYLQLANRVAEVNRTEVPQPTRCPFSVPLPGKRTELAITSYGDDLPDAVGASMRANANVAGTTIAAKALAIHLRPRLISNP